MKILKWEGNRHSAVNGIAHIEVEPGEIADIEEMLKMVDGDGTAHFGLSVKLIHEEDDIKGAYNCASLLKQHKRVYRCFVDRD